MPAARSTQEGAAAAYLAPKAVMVVAAAAAVVPVVPVEESTLARLRVGPPCGQRPGVHSAPQRGTCFGAPAPVATSAPACTAARSDEDPSAK
jgi:hypothetical protein